MSVTARGWRGLDAVREALAGRVTAVIGPSGVGKSTLVNELSPGADRATSQVSGTTGKGRHTSTASVLLPLAAGGWVVDTPGIRSFGLAHVGADTLLGGFADLAGGTEGCPRGCSHDEASAGWTPGWRGGTRRRTGWTASGGCCAPCGARPEPGERGRAG